MAAEERLAINNPDSLAVAVEQTIALMEQGYVRSNERFHTDDQLLQGCEQRLGVSTETARFLSQVAHNHIMRSSAA